MTHSQLFYLQRAERSKQRRQTFHGFAVKDDSTDHCADAQNRYSMHLSEEVFSPDVRKSSPLSRHKKRLCKSVTFKDTVHVDTNRQVHLKKSCNEDGESRNPKERCRRRSTPTGGDTEPEADVEALQGHTESNRHRIFAADKNWVDLFRESPLLSEKEKILDTGVVEAEHNDGSRTQDDQDCSVNNAEIVGCSGLATDIPIATTYNQEHSDSAKDIVVAEEMENPGTDTTVMENKHFPGHKSEDTLSKEGLVSLEGKASVKAKDSFEKEDAGRCSSVQESDNFSSQNWHWLRLFEEEFPRRSPRLRSTPNFGSQTVVSQGNDQPRKTKTARSKHSRTKKEMKDKITKCNMSDIALCNNLAEEITTEEFVFPRPSSEQTKNGGFLSVIVDFSLPDNEFAKLKLAKIKGALPVERINRAANYKSEKATEEYDILAESKYEEEMKEDCSHPLTKSKLACLLQMETNSAENTLEGNRTDKLQVLSTPVNLGCNKQAECTVNNSQQHQQHQQLDLLLQKEPVKYCNDRFSPKQQSQEDTDRQTAPLSPADVESCHQNSSWVETCCVTAVAHDVQQTIDIEKKNVLSTGDYETHELCIEQDKLDNKSSSDNNERLLVNTLQCDSRGSQEMNEFSIERDSNRHLKTGDIHETCGTEFPFEVDKAIQKTPEQLYDQRELFDLTEKRSSPSNHEPRIGDQATPHGKMKEPLETSQLTCMTSPEDRSGLSPVLMMACLQVCLMYYSS